MLYDAIGPGFAKAGQRRFLGIAQRSIGMRIIIRKSGSKSMNQNITREHRYGTFTLIS